MRGIRLGGVAAGLFVAGLLSGTAGMAVARDGASTDGCDARMVEHEAGDSMADMMGGSMMGSSMMGSSMMGSSMMGSSMMGSSMMGDPKDPIGPDRMGGRPAPGGSPMPGGQHEKHHPQTTPGAVE